MPGFEQEGSMRDAVNKVRRLTYSKLLIGTLGVVLVLALSFGGWVYRAKTQRDLNMQLLGAVRKGNAEEARQLLERGADPNIRDVPQQQLSLWQQIRYAFHKDRQTVQGQMPTVLEMAMHSDSDPNPRMVNAALVKTLLEAGAHPDDCSEDHITPLMVAVQFDSPQTVQMLLDHGANPLARDDDGLRPIHYLTGNDTDELKIADLLIKSGEDVNVTDNTGNTPLMNISGSENIPMVRYLIAHNANVNQRNEGGNTALTIAESEEEKETIRLLKAAGAKH